MEVALDQMGSPNERRLAFVDKNRDLYLSTVRVVGAPRKVAKLGVMVQSMCWNDSTNLLATMQDGKMMVYYYPNAVFVDKELSNKCIVEKEGREFGKSPVIVGFVGNCVTVRKANGSLVGAGIPPYPHMLHEFVTASRWSDAVRLCRFVKDEHLWACLAAMASYAKDLATAEVACAAINEGTKVHYIQYIKDLPSVEAKKAEMALFCGNLQDAEAILVQGGLVFRAIMMNIHLYNWERALEIAVKHKTHVDTVCAFRKKFLQAFDKQETNKRFKEYAQGVNIDWAKIEANMQKELEKERGVMKAPGNKLKEPAAPPPPPKQQQQQQQEEQQED